MAWAVFQVQSYAAAGEWWLGEAAAMGSFLAVSSEVQWLHALDVAGAVQQSSNLSISANVAFANSIARAELTLATDLTADSYRLDVQNAAASREASLAIARAERQFAEQSVGLNGDTQLSSGWSTSLPAMVTTRSNAASVPVYRIEMGVPVLS